MQIKCYLNLIEDNGGIIRAYGHIKRANLPVETRNPIMLERGHTISELILRERHKRVKHNGVREALTEFQSWVTKSTSFVKRIL